MPPPIPQNKQWRRVEYQKFSQLERRQNEQEIQSEAEFKIKPKSTEGLIVEKANFVMQDVEKDSTEILNTRGAEGTTGSKKNYITGDCAKMINNADGVELFPSVGEMKEK